MALDFFRQEQHGKTKRPVSVRVPKDSIDIHPVFTLFGYMTSITCDLRGCIPFRTPRLPSEPSPQAPSSTRHILDLTATIALIILADSSVRHITLSWRVCFLPIRKSAEPHQR